MTDINVGMLAEALNDKMERNGSNMADSLLKLIFSKIAAGLAMDVKRIKTLTWGTEFTASEPGWLVASAWVNNKKAEVYLDGVNIWAVMNNNYADGQKSPVFVAAGQTITYGGSYWESVAPTASFIPCKGV